LLKQLANEQTMDKRVFIKNFGCSSNTADGEVIAGCLTQAGYTLTPTESTADLLIYNTCAVKGPTENRIINEIKNAPKNKKIIIAGCLPKISFDRMRREVHFDGAVGPAVGGKIGEVVARVFAGETVVNFGALDKPLLSLPRQRTNPIISIIPINYGCLGSCSYCCVVYARGHLQSYFINEITERIKKDHSLGAREFWITSQDTASYGRDLHSDLAELLFSIGGLEGDFHVRVGMMTPNLVTDMQSRLIWAFESKKIFKFLHLPVQSGDDTVLQYMRRFYTEAEFCGIVDAFRINYPDLTLATDVIVGFPGETEQAFQNTLTLLEKVKPDVVNVSKFFARPKTIAWNLKEGLVEKEEIKRRSKVTADLSKRLSAERNQHWMGWSGKVLIDEKGKVEGSWVGRNFAYKPIAVKSTDNLLGKNVQVQVVEAMGTYLKAELCDIL
jgi:threonylcarbamoyladenosine tRNA methylthiotransferase CDKAL1